MNNCAALSDAILSFSYWDRPWELKGHVERTQNISASEQSLFAEIWAEATNGKHWKSSDLALCVNQVRAELVLKYPALKQDAIAAISNAVAYQWR
jgi:hypothetical protein